MLAVLFVAGLYGLGDLINNGECLWKVVASKDPIAVARVDLNQLLLNCPWGPSTSVPLKRGSKRMMSL